ncbi:hypothetical protein COV81_02120 [Candidatus Peregrinibacteria bacterium CG11_big_fil_rev_8_21_14_0_20_41_10]|nr:MAG: hypothetical protein COV81_02120 [Candidatus Peregrinibacteria bacterium CG11_big_fil_rev_8_21_14_0_20_41_10]PJC37629.1 MAG: hypothetical protein CO045_04560 [Candidatus Peregrinibacteria bacterium CG_4_9_14_0_2_um_filter_41_14]
MTQRETTSLELPPTSTGLTILYETIQEKNIDELTSWVKAMVNTLFRDNAVLSAPSIARIWGHEKGDKSLNLDQVIILASSLFGENFLTDLLDKPNNIDDLLAIINNTKPTTKDGFEKLRSALALLHVAHAENYAATEWDHERNLGITQSLRERVASITTEFGGNTYLQSPSNALMRVEIDSIKIADPKDPNGAIRKFLQRPEVSTLSMIFDGIRLSIQLPKDVKAIEINGYLEMILTIFCENTGTDIYRIKSTLESGHANDSSTGKHRALHFNSNLRCVTWHANAELKYALHNHDTITQEALNNLCNEYNHNLDELTHLTLALIHNTSGSKEIVAQLTAKHLSSHKNADQKIKGFIFHAENYFSKHLGKPTTMSIMQPQEESHVVPIEIQVKAYFPEQEETADHIDYDKRRMRSLREMHGFEQEYIDYLSDLIEFAEELAYCHQGDHVKVVEDFHHAQKQYVIKLLQIIFENEGNLEFLKDITYNSTAEKEEDFSFVYYKLLRIIKILRGKPEYKDQLDTFVTFIKNHTIKNSDDLNEDTLWATIDHQLDNDPEELLKRNLATLIKDIFCGKEGSPTGARGISDIYDELMTVNSGIIIPNNLLNNPEHSKDLKKRLNINLAKLMMRTISEFLNEHQQEFITTYLNNLQELIDNFPENSLSKKILNGFIKSITTNKYASLTQLFEDANKIFIAIKSNNPESHERVDEFKNNNNYQDPKLQFIKGRMSYVGENPNDNDNIGNITIDNMRGIIRECIMLNLEFDDFLHINGPNNGVTFMIPESTTSIANTLIALYKGITVHVAKLKKAKLTNKPSHNLQQSTNNAQETLQRIWDEELRRWHQIGTDILN